MPLQPGTPLLYLSFLLYVLFPIMPFDSSTFLHS
uniref:Macaca fascicularis brain cDNA clone: QmoA-11826, similar to human G protein-coupled receptor 34 (GPR34), mRNA, RefSeq: NM_005300.2 n=1 Tax=Macaca fascicularis TaxID=9541 RepID=I7GJV6_MACFA|nr:unnamed protein product [Macaca fascicularis]